MPCFSERCKTIYIKVYFYLVVNTEGCIFVSYKNIETMTTQMTIRQIRQELFFNSKYTVIGVDEMTNKESRDFLYEKDNQDEIMNVIDNGSHLLIWK